MIPENHFMARLRGVSFVELLMIVLVVTTALLPIFGLFSDNTRHVSFNMERATARILASQIIERYRYEPYDDLIRDFSSSAVGRSTIENDMILNELFIGIPTIMENLYFKFRREAWFEEITPGLLGQFTTRITWETNQGEGRTLTIPILIRNGSYTHGRH